MHRSRSPSRNTLAPLSNSLPYSPKYLHILRHTRCKILNRPRAQYRMLVGCSLIGIIASGEYEASLGLIHSRTCQIAIL